MSKKKAAKANAKGGSSKSKPHKTLKRVVQQVGKSEVAESLSDLKAGMPLGKATELTKSACATIKSRLLPAVLAEFEKDMKVGVRRSSNEIEAATGFATKQWIKYVSVYEKDAYVQWKNLPKQKKTIKPLNHPCWKSATPIHEETTSVY
jgi:hypothetical protein